jgi:uncharacterized membrane protein
MSQLAIDLVELFKFSFNQYKKYASFVIGAMLTYFVLAVVPQIYFMLRVPETPTTEGQFVSFLLTMIQLFLSLGFTKIMLLLVQDEFVEVADMFNNFRLFLSYFVASFLYGIAVALGTLLFIIPGIFIAIRFQFYPYFILEEGVSSFTALQKSYFLSQNLTFELLLFGTVVVILNVIGILLMGAGIIFTYPLTTMATAVVYKSLREEGQSIPSNSYRT